MNDSRWEKVQHVLPALGNYAFHALWKGWGFPRSDNTIHFIIANANHFEPLCENVGFDIGKKRLLHWCRKIEETRFLKDKDDHFVKHTYFFPAEESHDEYLQILKEHCTRGFGEVEIHLHHGIKEPDTSSNLKKTINEFKAHLEKHGFLSYDKKGNGPYYSFVHGNWALANSANGNYCGVDDEMQILRETGCYADFTYPSMSAGQTSIINHIFQCKYPLNTRNPQRKGVVLERGMSIDEIQYPFLVTGPFLINWRLKKERQFLPRFENADITSSYYPTLERFKLWASANVHVKYKPDWLFIKLHSHGIQENDEGLFWSKAYIDFIKDLLNKYDDGKKHRIHFVSTREMANIILAAINGEDGDPNSFRDYRFVKSY